MVNDMENVLESIGVTKNYAGKAAVDNVSLKLETGPCQTWKRGDFI